MGNKQQLHIVTGKGGVGKTTVAVTLALRAASMKRRVLLAETHAGDAVARMLGAPPVGAHLREVEERLFVVDMQPQAAMKEYALKTLRFEALYNLAFQNPVARSFVRLVPALAELVMLGKINHHFEQRLAQPGADDEPLFDTIIVDAPSTGHATTMLRAPRSVARTVPPGVLRRNCEAIHTLLTDGERCKMHIVTAAEEMPVSEAMDLVNSPPDIRQGHAFVNQYIAPLADEIMAALPDSPHTQVVQAVRLRQERALHGREELRRLPEILQRQLVYLPRLNSEQLNRQQLNSLARLIPEEVICGTGTTT